MLAASVQNAQGQQPSVPPGFHLIEIVRGQSFYPPSALRAGTQGRVELQYSLNTTGRPSAIVVLRADSPSLVDAAKAYLNNLQLDTTAGWPTPKNLAERMTMTVAFVLDDTPAPSPWNPSEQVVIIRRTSPIEPKLFATRHAPASPGLLSDLVDIAHPLPPMRVANTNKDFYPSEMRRANRQGDVLVAFSVDKEGHVTNPIILATDNPAMSDAALRWLGSIRYEVPSSWDDETQTWRRYRYMFRFRLGNCGFVSQEPPAGVDVSTVCSDFWR